MLPERFNENVLKIVLEKRRLSNRLEVTESVVFLGLKNFRAFYDMIFRGQVLACESFVPESRENS